MNRPPRCAALAGVVLCTLDLAATPVLVDRADDVGLRFHHRDGRSGKRYFLETLGGGVALFDCDGDGRLDVYCVSGADLPGQRSARAPRNALFRNRGDEGFEDITDASGAGDASYGFGCCVADYDDDGLLDIFVTNFGQNVLYRNRGGGRFTDVTAQAGVGGSSWSTGAAWLDFDGDGDLDLFVANYVAYEIKTTPEPCWVRRRQIPGYCHPQRYGPTQDHLYRNNGDGTFSDVTAAAGLEGKLGKGLGVVCGDYDGDGDIDIFVANDTTPNFLFRNVGGGRFNEVGLLAGVAYSEDGQAQAGMGVDLADYDGDGWLDFAVTNFSQESNSLYRNHRGEYFSENSFASGTGRVSHKPMGWGTGFFDFDRDGLRDWFVVNGHLQDNVHLAQPGFTYPQRNLLFRGAGNGRFEDVSSRAGPAMAVRAVGRGAAFGDVDNDGDIDVIVSGANSPLRYLRCEGPSDNHWLILDLRQPPPNRFAVGARVTLRAGKLLLVDEVRAGGSYLSHNDMRRHFGLGKHGRVDEIEVRWPDGAVEKRSDVAADHVLLWKREAPPRAR